MSTSTSSTVESSSATQFSTCKLVFSQQLSQLVQTLDNSSIEGDSSNSLLNEVKRVVQDSFGIKDDEDDQEQEQQTGTGNVPNWKLDTRRVIIERALDELVQESSVFPVSKEQQSILESRLDLLLTFVEAGYVDENVPLQTLAGLFELRPISACEPLLSYIESRVEILTNGMEYQRGRGPILLRLLNDLLRRLPRSKSGPVILSGRILMLLSSVYPLGEKSGVNLRGNFNLGKGTVWEQDSTTITETEMETEKNREEKELVKEEKVEKMEVEEGEEDEELNKASNTSFYSTFWSLQKYFNNPHLLFTTTTTTTSTTSASSTSDSTPPIQNLHSSLLTVLNAFSTETKKEKALSGSTTTTTTTLAAAIEKGKSSVDASSNSSSSNVESIMMGEKDFEDKTEQSLEQYFFPKFLTSRNLLSLELADPSFRLQFLFQTLILTQYLLSLTPNSRSRVQLLPLTNTSAFPSYVLSTKDEELIKSIEFKTFKEISSMSSSNDGGEGEGEGNQVLESFKTVLKRERNWTDWKLRSCLPFTKPSLDEQELKKLCEKVEQKLKSMIKPPPKFPYKMGNPRLSRVWSKDLKTLEGFQPDSTEDSFDSIVREWRMTRKKLEMTTKQLSTLTTSTSNPKYSELQSSIEPMKIKLQALHFRALRTASTQYLRHFSKIGSGDLEKLLQEIEKERRFKQEQEEEAQEKEEEEEEREKLEKKNQTSSLNEQQENKMEVGEGEGGGGKIDHDSSSSSKVGEMKSAIKLGDTPLRDETIEEEDKSKESGAPTKSKMELETLKRPREEESEEDELKKTNLQQEKVELEEEDIEMKDIMKKKKQKTD
ncbi:hypothetical protein JCM3765_005910 [Sporobolomyces pararoseus]